MLGRQVFLALLGFFQAVFQRVSSCSYHSVYITDKKWWPKLLKSDSSCTEPSYPLKQSYQG